MAKEVKVAQKKVYKKTQPVRLYVKGIFTGFRGGKTSQHEGQALVKVQNCSDLAGSKFYLGKRVAYVYKAKKTVNNTRFKVIWGKVVNTHGHAGNVRVKFAKNLPAQARGAQVRIMLYPNKAI